jgi:PAS domain S-box-containing protein
VEIHANHFFFENKNYVLAIVRDISQKKQQEEILLKKERAFRSLAENTPDNIARWDTEGRYLYINPVYEKTLGMTHSQALGTYIPEAHTEVISAIKQIRETGEPVSFVRQSILNEVGETEFHDVNLVPERDESGNIISILGIGRNMTEIYRLQDELIAKEEEFRTLTANSPDHIIRLDTQGRYLYLNPIHERTLGMPACEIIGRPKEELFPEHTAVLDAVERIVETGEEKITVFQPVPGENGKIEIHEVKLLAEKNSDGKIVSILGIGRDITEHRQMELELNTANKRYEEFFGNCADPCYLVEVTPDGRFIHLEINQAYVDAVKAPKEAIVGRYVDELEDEGFRDILTRKYSSCVSAKVGENVEFTGEYYLPKGMRIYHSVMTPIHGSDGSICRIAGIARDITEQKLAEEALHEREAFLDSLFNAIPIPVFYKDTNGIYLGVNRMYETYFGTTSEEFIGKSVFDIHPRELAEIYHAKDTEVFECRVDAQQYETQLKHSNGTLHDIIFSKAAFFDNKGHVKGLIGAILDITERKHSEKVLQKIKAKLSAVISAIPDLIWVKDADGVYMLCNPAFENFFGASCGEIIGKTDYDFITKEQADFFRKKDREAMESGEMCINEEEIVFANNRQRTLLETRKIPVYNGDEFMGILGIGRDITQRKQMEIELQNHAEFHNTLLNAMFDVGIQLMIIENGKIIYIGNRELARDFGYTDAELDAQPPLLDIIHPDDKARVADTYMRRLSGEEMPNVYDIGLITRDGKRREFETSVAIVPNTDPVRIVTVGRDITERKVTENKIDYLAHHDVLTGLPNRILLKNKAEKMIKSAKLNDSKVALLFIDLDEFKTINDTLSHLVGDKMLKVVSSRLKTIIKQDDIISRLGGDEFVILLQNINTYDEVILFAERVLKKFE